MAMSALLRASDDDLAEFRRTRLGDKEALDLERIKVVRDLVRMLGASLRKLHKDETWEPIAEAAKLLGFDETWAAIAGTGAAPAASSEADVDEVRDESPFASAAPAALKVEEKHEHAAGALSPEMAVVGAVPAPVSAAAAVPPPRVTTPPVTSAPEASPWSGAGAATPRPVGPPMSPEPPPTAVAVSPAPLPAGAAAFGARESGVPVHQTALGVEPTPEQRLRVSQPLPFSNPSGAAKAPTAAPMPAPSTAPVDVGQTFAGTSDSVQALPFATANRAAPAGGGAIADHSSGQDHGAGLPFGRAKTQLSGYDPPAQPQAPVQPPLPPRRPAASAPPTVDLETERMAAFTIEQYAEVWVMMAAYPNRIAELRTRYGLADEAAHEALNAHFHQRFASDPAQRATFTAACDQVKQRFKS